MFSFFKKKRKEDNSSDELQVEDVAEITRSLTPLIPTLRAWASTRFPDSKKVLEVFDVVKYTWGHSAEGASMNRSLVVLLDVSADAKYPDAKARILGLKFVSRTSPPSLSAIELRGVMPLGAAWPKSSAASNVTSWQSLVGMKRTDHSSAHELCRSILQRSTFFSSSVTKSVAIGWVYLFSMSTKEWDTKRMVIEVGPNRVYFLGPDDMDRIHDDEDDACILTSIEFANPTIFANSKIHYYTPPLSVSLKSKASRVVYLPNRKSFAKLVTLFKRYVTKTVDPSIEAVANRTEHAKKADTSTENNQLKSGFPDLYRTSWPWFKEAHATAYVSSLSLSLSLCISHTTKHKTDTQ